MPPRRARSVITGNLSQGSFKEWRYYNPVYNRHTLVKDTLIELDGRRLRIEIAIDISADTKQNEIIRDYQNKEALINEALRTAMLASDPETSLKIAIEYLGKALGGERVYILRKTHRAATTTLTSGWRTV